MPFYHCLRAGLPACLCILTAWTSAAFSQTNPSDSEGVQQLAAIVNQALESNPEILAAQAAADAAQARLNGAAQPLNNPELELETERTDINTYRIGINQTIDWYGKQSVFRQVAEKELAVTHARVEALRLSKSAELLDAFGSIATQHEVTTLSKQRSEILDRFVRLAERRLDVGDISLAELELARLSLAQAVMQHAGNGSRLIEARSNFFSISGQSMDKSIRFPKRLPLALSEARDDEALIREHPQVRAARQRLLAARQRIQATELEHKADPTFGLSAGREDRENLVALSLSIPLQIRNDFRSNVDAAQAQALQVEQEAHQVFRNQLAAIESARKRYKLVANAWALWVSQGRTSLQQRIELLDTLWQAGEIGTTDYLLQVQQTLDTQIAGVELHGDLWNAWIEWLSASGTLDAWLNQSSTEL